jgi:hypothetical protein
LFPDPFEVTAKPPGFFTVSGGIEDHAGAHRPLFVGKLKRVERKPGTCRNRARQFVRS